MLGFQTSELGGNNFLWFKLLPLLYFVMAVLATHVWTTCVLLKMHLWFSRSGVASASTLLIASRWFWCSWSRDDPLNSKELVLCCSNNFTLKSLWLNQTKFTSYCASNVNGLEWGHSHSHWGIHYLVWYSLPHQGKKVLKGCPWTIHPLGLRWCR